MTQLLQHFRFAFRTLVRTPSFTAVALITLALGIGANAAIFSVVNGVLLRPLPFPEPDALYQLERTYPGDQRSSSLSLRRYQIAREGTGSVFSSVTAYEPLASGFNLIGEGAPERLVGVRVTHEYLRTFGARPALGRDFNRADEAPGAAKVVLLSDRLWRRRFGAEPAIVGRPLSLNGEPYTVAGVLPASFRFPAKAELWAPLTVPDGVAAQPGANYLMVVGRLKPGVGEKQGNAVAALLEQRFRRENPEDFDPKQKLEVISLHRELYGNLRPALLVLLGAVLCVLLIACVNVANLQLARAGARRREIALRTALGAGAGRIVGQLLVESLVLAIAGGLLGLFIGFLILKPLLAVSPVDALGLTGAAELPPIGFDWRVLAFTFGLALVAGILFGLVPALQAARPDLREPLQEGTARTTGGPRGALARRLLVVFEVALALILATGAALLAKSFSGLVDTDPGFRTDNVLAVKMSLSDVRYGGPDALERFARQLGQRVQGLPGVRSVAVASSLPLEAGPDLSFTVVGKERNGKPMEGDAQYRAVEGKYFETLHIRLLRGRLLEPTDGVASEAVVVVNETVAKRYWPGEEAVGRAIRIGDPAANGPGGSRRVVGVVADVREVGLDQAAPEVLYVPIGQMPADLSTLLVRLLPISLLVRTEGAPTSLTHAVEKELWAVDPTQAVASVEALEKVVERSIGVHRFNLLLMMGLAVLALMLAGVGIYGVLSYLVGQRTREMGIRMALGASSGKLLWMVVFQALVPVAVGLALGLGGALGLTRFLKSLLVGVSALDPAVFALTPLVLAAIAFLASAFPARRASQLDPLVALRDE
jgi:predicted permease